MTFNQPSPWTDPVLGHFSELLLVRPVLSYSDIAHRLNRTHGVALTKNACIGRARRMGFLRGQPKAKPRARIAPNRLSLRLRKIPTGRSLPAPKPRVPFTVQLEQLRAYDCRWPQGDRAPFLFCGEPVTENCSYCLKHALISYPAMRKEHPNV